MNLKGISFYLGLFLFPIVFLSFINILYASYFDYFLSIEAYLITLCISLIFAIGLYIYGRKAIKKINFIEQLILIILVYFLVGFLISMPYYLNNFQISFVNAFFESISVFVTANTSHVSSHVVFFASTGSPLQSEFS